LAADLTVQSITGTKAAAEPVAEARAGHVRKTGDAAQKFEAFVLQSFIQEMMPQSTEGVFGSGLAGGFWKSMMSEKIAEQVAERGSIGIAEYVRAGHVAPVRPSGFASLDTMSAISTMNGGVADQLDVKSTSGE
jgi:hypothetical protein